MKYKLCLMAGIIGIAVISGIIEALSATRTETGEEGSAVKEALSPDSAGI
jgi:hypothetical protein